VESSVSPVRPRRQERVERIDTIQHLRTEVGDNVGITEVLNTEAGLLNQIGTPSRDVG
jgi:hypothetical protein